MNINFNIFLGIILIALGLFLLYTFPVHKMLYHKAMEKYYGWRKDRLIAKFKRKGEAAGLPSLDGYSNDAIAEGLRRLLEERERNA